MSYEGKRITSAIVELEQLCQSDELLSKCSVRDIIRKFGLTPSEDNILFSPEEYCTFFIKACCNENVTKGILLLLMEYFPGVEEIDEDGLTPLHSALSNKNVTYDIVELLLESFSDSIHSADGRSGDLPIHVLCSNEAEMDRLTAMEILKLLLEKAPGSVKKINDEGFLPLHCASRVRYPEFLHMLIRAYPGSQRIKSNNGDELYGVLPLHIACGSNRISSVKYLYNLYPDAVKQSTPIGHYPIHWAIMDQDQSMRHSRDVPSIVQFLLHCDPHVKLQKWEAKSLLHLACLQKYNGSNIDVGIQVIKVIYDACPEAIEDDFILCDFHRLHEHVQAFINGEMIHWD